MTSSPKPLHLILMLAPSMLVVIGLFLGGFLLAILQSLGYLPFLGQTELSFKAYYHLLTFPEFYQALLLSLWISITSTILATLFALISALTLRKNFKYQRDITFIFQLNLPIPHLVGAIGMLFLLSQSGFLARLAYLARLINTPAEFPIWVFDPWAIAIIAEYVWKATTFIGVILLATLQSIGEDYEQVAQTLGANRWQRFRYILWPLIRPGVLSASILVFTFTFGAFEVPLLLGQQYPTPLPILAYRYYTDPDLNYRPEAMAVSVIISLIAMFLVFIYIKLSEWIQ